MTHWKKRLRASGIHLSLSLLVAAFAGLLVFTVWYPYPYRDLSGGRELFLLVVAVDVILGPLITLAVFSRRKPWGELRRDLAVVAVIQLSALGYGLWTVAVARPVHLVFEVDRFRVVHAIEVPQELMERGPALVQPKPWFGPTMLAVRQFQNPQEDFEATMAALQGLPLAARPDLWQPYGEAQDRVLLAAKPVSLLIARFAAQREEIDKALQASGRSPDALAYLPLVGRKSLWTALIDRKTADVVGFLPLDSF
jgi:hypothetical protein